MTDPKFSVSTEHGRYYIRPSTGVSVPSVTNIIGMKDKPGLKWWAAKTVAQYAAENRASLAMMTEEQAFSVARHTPFRHADDSPAAIGDIVHGFIEQRIKGTGPSHEDVKHSHRTVHWMWDRFLKFEAHYKPEYTGSEFTVWSERYGYAGTGDFSMKIGEHHVLVDTKTGNQVYPESGMQVAALGHADLMFDPDGHERAVPAYDKFAILHIRPKSFALYPVENVDKAFECFLALKTVFDWHVGEASKTIAFAPKHTA
jgi:hypothetical protein